MTLQFEIVLTAIFATLACAIPGVFLVLRRVALMSDAISHAILLGIVIAFFMVKNLYSPVLLLAAVATGIITVALTEIIIKTNRLKKDAAIGLIFPAFFSIAIILIHQFADKIHLDMDAVILGELAFVPFNRITLSGVDMGPMGLWMMGGMFLLNLVFVFIFYKELKIATFDEALSSILGFSPLIIHYLLMSLVSITAVSAFEVVGSILVVALMITPPATAYLITHSLKYMLILSGVIGAVSAVLGYGVAALLDVSIAGSMATMTGLLFLLTLFLSPSQGLFIRYLKSKDQRLDFASKMLLVQLLAHENTEVEKSENTVTNMIAHMDWSEKFAHQVAAYSVHRKRLTRQGNALTLTALGREQAKIQLRQ